MRTSEAFCRISSSSRPFSFTVVKISNAKINKCLVATDITFLKLRSLKKKERKLSAKANRIGLLFIAYRKKKCELRRCWWRTPGITLSSIISLIIHDNSSAYRPFSVTLIFEGSQFQDITGVNTGQRKIYIHTCTSILYIYIIFL